MDEPVIKSSILTTTKKLLGIEEEYEHFDQDITVHINSALFNLNQLGVGLAGFSITNKEDAWEDFLEERKDLNAVKTYVYLKVKLVFDPPQMGYFVDAIKDQCKELEWRLNVQAEGGGS
jgi:hypothetical protein